jgi:signal peptidase I
MKRSVLTRLAVLGGVLLLLLVANQFYRLHFVVGVSMQPTLKPWDLCLMARVGPYQPQRGDIVVFRTADDPPLYFIKRVVGLPGETVAIRAGLVHINDQPLQEPYTQINPSWMLAPVTVDEDKIFVLSDNRVYDADAYVQGLVASRLVQARLLRAWRWKPS